MVPLKPHTGRRKRNMSGLMKARLAARKVGSQIERDVARQLYAPIERTERCNDHVASLFDWKICARCGVHIDELRPPDDA